MRKRENKTAATFDSMKTQKYRYDEFLKPQEEAN
jgi:hypothetical protein